MEYTDELAHEVVKKFDLSDKTIKVWKTRGKIPAKYFQEGFEKRKELDRAGLALQKKLMGILKSPKLNAKYIAELAEIPYHTVQDCMNERQNISEQELNGLRKRLQEFRIDLKKTVEELQKATLFSAKHDKLLLSALKREELFLRPVLKFEDDTDNERVKGWKLNKQTIPDSLKMRVVDRLAVLILETSL
jgi:hypothetical protein